MNMVYAYLEQLLEAQYITLNPRKSSFLHLNYFAKKKIHMALLRYTEVNMKCKY